ncbi:MAG: biotin/lipoyl-binding protein [Firmicutes bacterium]|nr:biotin/lipoyl-binding protein [Bacillota bacterium]
MKKRLKWILWGVVVAALVGVSVYSATRPLQAELLEIKPRTIEKKFTESGTVSAVWQKDFFSVSGGKVLTVNVKEGDEVAAGELLLALDTRDIDYQIVQLEGQLISLRGQERQALSGLGKSQTSPQPAIEQLKIQLQSAQEEHERMAVLYQADAVSKSDLDEAERAVRQLELLLAQQEQLLLGAKEQFAGLESSLRAQIALLEYQRENAEFIAPEKSTVVAVHVKEGEVVAPGAPLISLYRPGEYEVDVYLLPEDVVHVQPGMDVRVAYKGLSGEDELGGKVTKIAHAAVERISSLGLAEQRVKVTVELSGDVSSLRSGYAMDVTFVTRCEENSLVVPKTALFTYEGESAVWVVRRGKAEIQPVEKGLEADDEVAVVSGLAEGDLVIRNTRLEGLKDGARIVQQ